MAALINSRRLIVRTRKSAAGDLHALTGLESVLESTDDGVEPATWISTPELRPAIADLHPWDVAHGILIQPAAANLESLGEIEYVEPDFVQSFPYRLSEPSSLESADSRSEACALREVNADWPNPATRFGWHLDDEYTQLRGARAAVGDPGDGRRVLIGILDTGYDPGHDSLPRHMRIDLARNFTDDGEESDAVDPGSSFPMTNPGHGTATLAILAGNRIVRAGNSAFDHILGGAPFAEVAPIRIADSVIHFRTSSMAAGIEYAADIGCRVVSISMGGVPTRLWASAVNKAYEAGTCLFAAGGNRVGPTPPKTLVYPARFHRVVAVCGFTSDKSPYFRSGLHRMMHGCFGPSEAMATAMSAYTPNIPWADMGCVGLVNPDGAGTSSATPQCAAAAALWLQKHDPAPAERWRIIEAVRHALFSTADKSPAAGSDFFGQGLLRAHDALGVPFRDDLPKSPAADVSFPWLRLSDGTESLDEASAPREQMLETETLQLFMQTPSLQTVAGGADPQSDDLERPTLRAFLDRLRALPSASATLRRHADDLFNRV